MTIFVLTISFVILYSIIESLHDINIIRDSANRKKFINNWHLYGFMQNAQIFTLLFISLFILDSSSSWSLMIASGFIFWQLHDSIIGYALHKDIFYMSKDKTSAFIDKVFNGGMQFMIVRSIFILCSIIEYFRQIN